MRTNVDEIYCITLLLLMIQLHLYFNKSVTSTPFIQALFTLYVQILSPDWRQEQTENNGY